ncbi:phosphatidate cytidylyltransferase, mitochondrial-like isoform X2 [Uloborus diversus]|uniref:phosphatidate cytidylyltransferase, mitochondrial-like isoform X2 n=1 Tax=Uloborus diversus TaxID=327109 RepID=UPI00240A679E|nr:phosphatidate cytidylyltransferase, mitochondrial-like isoform X2 [Uloborus diversus]
MLFQSSMIDFIFVVDDPLSWHKANLQLNRNHYSILKFAGPEVIKLFQEEYGAKMYFNTLVPVGNQLIKYGVISTDHLVEDLLDWQTMYPSGRLHKPVQTIREAKNNVLKKALYTNLQSVLHAALLCLGEFFTEEELYQKITGLSYNGDFRMYFGEDKRKIINIVKHQVPHFQKLYSEHIQSMPGLHWIKSRNMFEQDCSNESTLHHLNLLPKMVQHNLLIEWNKDGKYRDMEEVLSTISCDPDCEKLVEKAINTIVWWSSITQSLKGIVTAGLKKSFLYSSRKIMKMITSL